MVSHIQPDTQARLVTLDILSANKVETMLGKKEKLKERIIALQVKVDWLKKTKCFEINYFDTSYFIELWK